MQLRIGVDAPELDAAELDRDVAEPLTAALAGLRDVQATYARSDDGRVDLSVTLAAPAAIEAVRDALARPRLPAGAGHPVLARVDGVQPAIVIAASPEAADVVRPELERIPGVARVDLCGARQPRHAVLLDRTRLDRAPIDQVLAACEAGLASTASEALPERLAAVTIAGDTRVRDVAIFLSELPPPTCRAFDRRGPVALLTAYTQTGANPRDVAADLRARVRELAPAAALLGEPLPPVDAPDLAILALELAPADDPGSDLARCLADLPDLPAWALTFPEPPDPQVRARLHFDASPTFPFEPVLRDMAQCAGVQRVAVLAPAAVADHGLGVHLFGADPPTLARLADAAAAELAGLPAVTSLRVRAARERPEIAVLRRDVLAARNISLAAAVQALRLAGGPLTLTGRDGSVDIDLIDRTGPLDQILRELKLAAPSGPVPLADLVELRPGAPGPLHRVDREPAATLELRLRRAADRELVLQALQRRLELPAGVRLELGPELPSLDP